MALLAAEGAIIVDATDLRELGDEVWEDELLVLLAEFRAGVADYLATRAGDVPRTLEDVVAFNREHAATELAHFGQSLFEKALAGPLAGSPEHLEARARGVAATRDGASTRCCASTTSTRWSRRRTLRPAPSTSSTPSPSRAPAPARPPSPVSPRDRPDRARGRAAGRGVVLGHRRLGAGAHRDRRRLRGRARRRPAAPCPSRRSRRSCELRPGLVAGDGERPPPAVQMGAVRRIKRAVVIAG